MKKVLIILAVVVAIVIAAAAISAYVIFNKYSADPTFAKGTTLNKESVAGMTPAELADLAANEYDTEAHKVEILEDKQTAISGTLKDFGYTYDKKAFEDFLNESYEEQRKDVFTLIDTLMNGFSMTASESYLYDSSAVSKIVVSDNLAKKRYKTVDNKMVFDADENRYHIEKGKIGNEIDDKALQEIVSETIAQAVRSDVIPDLITIEIPKEIYTSKEPAGDLKKMQAEADEKNYELAKQEVLDSYRDVSVTYMFGNQSVLLDFETFRDWISIDRDLNVTFDPEMIAQYVRNLKDTYDTIYQNRVFNTSTGNTVVIAAGENSYGYSIDYEAEFYQLAADLDSKSVTVREPIYFQTNDYGNPLYYSRNGVDDLNGTYVEVNLTEQHLWYYAGGNLVVESDFVSGSVADKAETQTGAFPLAYKQSPETLTGPNASGSGNYSIEVQYWMPFYEGQGLHDAAWRPAFGGDIYIKNGSHGCVNLPFDVAETIYFNIEPGVPIIIYKE